MSILHMGGVARQLLKTSTAIRLIPDVITPQAEEALVAELDPVMKRRRYSSNHWDSVIVGYKEVERPFWNDIENQNTIDLIRRKISEAIEDGGTVDEGVRCPVEEWLPVHAIDLAPTGFITPHVDSVKFSGGLVCGVSLLSSAVMTLRPDGSNINDDDENDACVRMLLPRRSLYILSGAARYGFAHSIEPRQPEKDFPAVQGHQLNGDGGGGGHQRGRRMSLIFRDAKPAEAR
jgi:alkylated DNA repair protein alkB family protein 7